MEEKNNIEFTSEAEKLSNWYKPKVGKQIIKFLDNGRKETRKYDGEETEIAIFKIEVDGEEYKWSININESENSLWGKIVNIGSKFEGIKGERIELVREGRKKQTKYYIKHIE